MQAWRESIPDDCRGCQFEGVCGGGCRAEGQLAQASKDPLILRGSPHRHSTHGEVLDLHREQTYAIACKRRTEPYGELLFYEGEVVLVDHSGVLMLESVGASMSTGQIKASYGDEGLRLLAELLLRGFVVYRD